MKKKEAHRERYSKVCIVDQTKLFARFVNGDEDAFREIYEIHKIPLYSYALTKLKYDVAEAEDQTAFAFSKLWNNRKSMESLDHVRGWLYEVARNGILNHYKKKRRGYSAYSIIKSTQAQQYIASEYELDHFERAHSEMVAALMSEIDQLPDHLKVVFNSIFFEKKSGKEASLELNISEATVTRRKQEAFKILQDSLLKKGMIPVLIFLLSRFPA